MKNITVTIILLMLLSALSVIIYACAGTQSIAVKHPVEVTGLPVCSECHTDYRAAMNHTDDFYTRHKLHAAQGKGKCLVCHKESFCSDCHANIEELKPSDKYKDSPQLLLPHRGDYVNQHKIDGRINPAKCFTCHGRSNNERCKVCNR